MIIVVCDGNQEEQEEIRGLLHAVWRIYYEKRRKEN